VINNNTNIMLNNSLRQISLQPKQWARWHRSTACTLPCNNNLQTVQRKTNNSSPIINSSMKKSTNIDARKYDQTRNGMHIKSTNLKCAEQDYFIYNKKPVHCPFWQMRNFSWYQNVQTVKNQKRNSLLTSKKVVSVSYYMRSIGLNKTHLPK